MTIPGNSPYHAAKWAVGGFSDSLAAEVAPFGVKVCTLEPGGMRTSFKQRAAETMPAAECADKAGRQEQACDGMLCALDQAQGEGGAQAVADKDCRCLWETADCAIIGIQPGGEGLPLRRGQARLGQPPSASSRFE